MKLSYEVKILFWRFCVMFYCLSALFQFLYFNWIRAGLGLATIALILLYKPKPKPHEEIRP